MNVPTINQGPGGVAAPPAAEAAANAARSRVDADARSANFTRLAWFDVNGDGSIDPRSASSGGDATLLVPAHEVDLPTYARPAHSIAIVHSATTASSPVVNAAQANRAVVAYQRYGQQPPAPPAPPVATQPQPQSQAPPQPQPASDSVPAELTSVAAAATH